MCSRVLPWIASHLPKDTYVNLMSRCQPLFQARQYPEIARRMTREEYVEAVNHARSLGLTKVDVQGWRG